MEKAGIGIAGTTFAANIHGEDYERAHDKLPKDRALDVIDIRIPSRPKRSKG